MLLEFDVEFNKCIEVVKVEGKVLCYVGLIVNGKCCVVIEVVDFEYLFYKVKNGENVFVFFICYYSLILFLLCGYGVGNSVMVVGIFVDILCILYGGV